MKSHPLFRRNRFWRNVVNSKELLLMLAIPVIYIIINRYIPMIGVILAFKEYNYAKGIFGSDWVGLKNFYLF